jgi:hypothetical protein
MSLVNTEILRNPANWLVIALVVIIVSYGAKVIFEHSGQLTPDLPTPGEL